MIFKVNTYFKIEISDNGYAKFINDSDTKIDVSVDISTGIQIDARLNFC